MTRIPVVTYRIQFNPSFDFQAARDIIPDISALAWLKPDTECEDAYIAYVKEILREENQFPEEFGISKKSLPLGDIQFTPPDTHQDHIPRVCQTCTREQNSGISISWTLITADRLTLKREFHY